MLDIHALSRELPVACELAAPPALGVVTHALVAAGFEAYVVGGAVRDLILQRLPISDWDLATRATPDQMAELFPRTTLLHAAHGTVQVREGGAHFEITTYREDGPYSDHRRPDFVRFADSIEDDLSRRDFTVNALAYDPEAGTLVDPFDGVGDLGRRRIRAVGDPATRFREDALRLLRAARFAAVLEFGVDGATTAAMTSEADRLAPVSAERKRDEIVKLMGAPRPSVGLRLLAETKLLRHVIPELEACRGVAQNAEFHAFDVFEHTLRAVDHTPPENLLLRLTTLMHDVGKVPTRVVRDGRVTFYNHERVGGDLVARRLRELKLSRRDIAYVEHLVRQHMYHYEPSWSDAAVRRFVQRVTPEALDDLFALRVADTLAKRDGEPSPAAEIDALRARIDAVVDHDTAFRIRDLAIGGRDLMDELGVPSGPELGTMLQSLLAFVLDEGAENTREVLLKKARDLRGRE